MAEKRVYGIFCGWLLVLCLLPGLIQAAELTREHILAMHNGGIRMALGKADGTSEKPYVIPVDIDPAKLLGTELLDFSGRPLVELPPWLGRFNKLRKLDLSKTGIKADDALLAALGNMPELDVLKLNDNPLFPEKSCWMFCDPEVSLAAVWSKLTGLTEINLTNTGGTAANLGSFAALENLTHLYLGGNRIGDEVNKLGLGNPSNVRYLNFANNGIHDSPLPYLPTQTLVELDLSGNALGEVSFIDMPVLERWDMSGNAKLKLADGFASMFALPRLQYLSVSDAAQAPPALAQRLQKMAEEKRFAEAAAIAAEEKRKIIADRYRINDDGTVTDTKTGLMWKRCQEGRSGSDCRIGSWDSGKFLWNEAMSKFGSNVNYAGYADWRMPRIDELRTLVECSNGVSQEEAWHTSCSKNNTIDNYRCPTINTLAFPNTISAWFWSSSDLNETALSIYFCGGNYGQYAKGQDGVTYDAKAWIRLVRDMRNNEKQINAENEIKDEITKEISDAKAAEEKRKAEAAAAKAAEEKRRAAEENRLAQEKLATDKVDAKRHGYLINDDSTVTDTKTGLMWKRCSEGAGGYNCDTPSYSVYRPDDYETVLSTFGSGVRFAGYSDWRIPSPEELRTLIYCSNGISWEEAWKYTCLGKKNLELDKELDYQQPTINASAFPNNGLGYWTSDKKRYVNFDVGVVVPDRHERRNAIRLVRDAR